jgi:hypothetical protein
MSELGWFILVVGVIVGLVGAGVMVKVFAWFSQHNGRVKLEEDSRSLGSMLYPVAGLLVVAGILAGFIRLLRPYMF